MEFLARVLGGDLRASTPGLADDWWYRPVNSGALTQAGVSVDQESAQKLSAWFRGKDLLSTALAMLPFQVFERLPNGHGSQLARHQPLYDVLHTKPNPWQDSFSWRRMLTRHIIDYGNAYKALHGTEPGTFGGNVFDAGLLLQGALPAALKAAKPGTPEFRAALRDAIEKTKELVATQGFYNMTPSDHSGFDERGRVMVTVRDGKWVLLK